MRTKLVTLLVMSLMLGGAMTARAQSGSAEGSASNEASVQGDAARHEATGLVRLDTRAKAQVQSEQTLQAIRKQAGKTTAKGREAAEGRLQAAIQRVNQAAQGDELQTTFRLAAEFGTSREEMIDESKGCECSLGDLVVAHTLAANSKQNVTTEQLIDLRHEMSWSEIAAGLGFHLSAAAGAVKTEAQAIASGQMLDGKVAPISGPGAKAGVDLASSGQLGKDSGSGTRVGAVMQGGVSVTPPVIVKP